MPDWDGQERRRHSDGIGERLARIEEKIDQALKAVVDHEKRLRGLERFMAGSLAVAAIIGAAFSLIASWVRSAMRGN